MPAANVAKPGRVLPAGRVAVAAAAEAPRKSEPDGSVASPFDAQIVSASPFDVDESRAPRPAVQAVHDGEARYFVITSSSAENVVKSIRHNVWATQRKNEQKLDEAYRSGLPVLLLFSVQRSEAFQGYARMRSAVGRSKLKGTDPFHGFGRLFDVEWLRLHDLPFREVQQLRNPLADDAKVTLSRDGQELASSTGHKLCALIDKHIDEPESFPVRREVVPTWQMSWPLPAPGPGPVGTTASERSESEGTRRKRRRKLRNAPHALEDGFDKQVEYFLSLDYQDYLEWWKRSGAVSPGPAPLP
mmetsp:Transcript_786/g.1967  ORF Transcript_786/g.1967 Transcript_786/m.1967 type:complete len:301 (-) Transcript_786:76-978(-)